MIRRAALAVAIATTSLSLGGIFAIPASAGTGTACYQKSCDGHDPNSSYNSQTGQECSTAAYTVPGGYFSNVYSGTLEMRWGPDCAVNWTRYTVGTHDSNYNGAHFYITTTASDGSSTTYDFIGQGGVTYYGNEEFSPGPATMCLGIISSGIEPIPFCWTQPS
jgi:hypothetical protein